MTTPQASITCPLCQRVSYHPMDVSQRYCGHCHVFHADVEYIARIVRTDLAREQRMNPKNVRES